MYKNIQSGDFTMRILAIGDVVGSVGSEFLCAKLSDLKKIKKVDLAIVNGENSAEGNGITPESALRLFNGGADIITTGNHVFRRKEIRQFIDDNPYIIRPYNYPEGTTPGRGMCKIDLGGIKVCVINILGVSYLESMGCPFDALDRALVNANDCKIKIVDFHAEATAEKRALGFYADGRISALFGTHTHVQTSDECILPTGTGYITDVGMTGVINSVLGVKAEISIKRMKEKLPIKFENARGACKMEGIIFDVDDYSGKTKSVERLRITPQFNNNISNRNV